VELPFTGLDHPYGVAVDGAGNVYVADHNNDRVVKLPAGSTAQVELPFTGFSGQAPPNDVAVDSTGNVYAVDGLHQRILELVAVSSTQVELPFGTGPGNGEGGVAVDATGNLYVADPHRVLKLPAR